MKPKDFVKTVLKNCGVIRNKNTKILDTERGLGFMRKFKDMKTHDPLSSFFGKDSTTASNIFGGNTTMKQVGKICHENRSLTQMLKTLMP